MASSLEIVPVWISWVSRHSCAWPRNSGANDFPSTLRRGVALASSAIVGAMSTAVTGT